MKQQRGFTLVELIIVIVILGILAVTAAPRFFDFSDQARSSTIEGLKAAVQGASEIGYANNALSGSAAYPLGQDLIDDYLNITSVEAGDYDNDYEGNDEWVYAVDGDILYITLTSVLGNADALDHDDISATECFLSYDGSVEPPLIVTDTEGC
ncbi:prepilin-type N-terminal cleavage/methylation domain-containing protein [Aliidiomarina halalkaliphila]|uniref:Prepilin-type N-terminal cleavage/methylation domain-containing protein n=1 Tax=Aliidiomarina halalkaliphila TaxID=2593535 RepID=A0A552X799_9GAMM|nr:prepilin-type N-terminal cleavage/methylation domain-containing protein [Aliidiomarina halalkaliphila]TRW50463.1 prepilin-type N-terminal cleavage/methylation domain-containing protein [Aliidiomarina halalkaliphila]